MAVTPENPHEFYETPPHAIAEFLREWGPRIARPRRILEPCAGAGAFIEPLRVMWPCAPIDAFDIEPRHPDVQQRDALMDDEPAAYDLIITNPAFSLAQAMVSYCLPRLTKGGRLVLLLPDGFMHSQGRVGWWREHMPEARYAIPYRISFTKDGKTDMRDCSWYIWREGLQADHYRGYLL